MPHEVSEELRCVWVKPASHKRCKQPRTPDPSATNPDLCSYHNVMLLEQTQRWRLAQDAPDLTPDEVLLEELKRAYVMTRTLELMIHDEGLEHLLEFEYTEVREGTGAYVLTRLEDRQRSLLLSYRAEREHLLKVTQVSIAAGIAQRQLELAERFAGEITQAMLGLIEDLGLDPHDPSIREKAARRLMLVAERRELEAGGA